MPDGVHTMAPPARHHDITHKLADEGYPTPIRGEQGFLLEDWSFADRPAAFESALAAGQITQERAESHRRALYSEDLW
jgi:hypothetical protein